MTQSPTPSLLKLVNMPELLDRVDNDRELLQEIFELFRAEFSAASDRVEGSGLKERHAADCKSSTHDKGYARQLVD
jgi:hypothetical protein